MAKQSGLGDNLYVGGYDLSGDIQALDSIHGGATLLEFTAITQSAHERQLGVKDGSIGATTYFNATASQAHPVLSALPTTDVGVMYCRGTTLGGVTACCVGKQVGYDGTRDDAGNLTLKTEVDANGYGLEWGRLLTAGIRTDTAATNGSSIDTVASASFGGQAYLQVFAFSGTDVTVKIQDSANNSAFADVTGLAFTQITSGTRQTQRISISNTSTIRQYVRAITVTTGGVTSVSFAVSITKNPMAGVTF